MSCLGSSGAGVAKSGASVAQRAFTLVEMLVVVAIILIVAVMALPAVTSLSKAAARRSAVSQAMSVLDQARAIALSQSTVVYVAFANGDPAIPEDYRFRSYAVFREVYYPEHREYVPAGESKAAPYHLEVVRPWTKLPDGVAFKPTVTEGEEKTVFDGPTDKFTFRLDGSGGSSTTEPVELPYLRFNAVGLIEEQPKPSKARPDDSTRVRLFEGFVDATGKAVMTNAGRSDAEESVILSPITGRAHREEAKRAG